METFSTCVCVCNACVSYSNSLSAWYVINRLWEFHQIYDFGAVWDKDELIRFWDEKFKGQSETTWSNKCYSVHFLTCLQNTWTYYNETYHNYSLPRPRDIDDIFRVMDSKVRIADNIFRNRTFPADMYGLMVCRRKLSSFRLSLILWLLLCHMIGLFAVYL